MGRPRFQDLLEAQWAAGRHVCVGLDIDLRHKDFPPHMRHSMSVEDLLSFGRAIVDATHDLVAAFKPNSAFFERWGGKGLDALQELVRYIHVVASEVVVVDDAKRGDIDNTNNGYVEMAFDWLGADAITVAPYMGGLSLAPFRDRADKGVFILCRTSNKGAGEFQDCPIVLTPEETDEFGLHPIAVVPFYQYVAHRVSRYWNGNRNCGLVVGATAPAELARVSEIAPKLPKLIPGAGKQGGDVPTSVKAAGNHYFIINSSRDIIFASKEADFAEAARRETQKLHDSITTALAGLK